MPATSGGFSNLLSTQFQKVLLNVGKEMPLKYPDFIRVEDMPVNPYLATKISGLGAMPTKPEGQQFPQDQPIIGNTLTVTAVAYGMLFEVTFEMYDDDQYDIMDQMWREEGRSARYRQEVSAWSIFNNAFSVATGYDAADLCSTSHSNLDGSTGSNRPSPDVTLSQTAIQAGQLSMRTVNNDRSLPALMEPTRLLIQPTNVPIARELLGSNGKPYTANNENNALLPDELMYYSSRYLVRTQDWFIAAPKEESDCSLMWRNRPIVRHFDDPFTMNGDFTTYQRFALYVGDWRWIYGSTTGV